MCNSLLDNYSSNPRANKIGVIMRLCIFVAIGLLSAGGGVSSIGTPSAMNTSRTLTLVGYIVFAVMLAVLISMMAFFWRKKHTLLSSSQIVCPTFLSQTYTYKRENADNVNSSGLARWSPRFHVPHHPYHLWPLGSRPPRQRHLAVQSHRGQCRGLWVNGSAARVHCRAHLHLYWLFDPT